MIVNSDKHARSKNFIAKAIMIHNNKFGYELVDYINNYTPVTFICYIHGIFNQTPAVHLSGSGCRLCSEDKYRTSSEDFIARARIIHNAKYQYEKVLYVRSHDKVLITCPIHGDFLQTPASHLAGIGCPYCAGNIINTLADFIAKARLVHGDKYDYSKVVYINNRTKVIIICPIHGEFEQIPGNHLRGKGCSVCGGSKTLTTEEFIAKARKVHGDTFGYSKVDYVNYNTDVTLICDTHGDFEQNPNTHLNGNGCRMCRATRGEYKIRNFLVSSKIEYKIEYRIPGYVYRYDFYLPKLNILIEYDGKQHFIPNEYFGGKEGYLKTITNDKEKNKLAAMHNIPLIRIPYTEFDILEEYLLHKISKIYKYRVKNKFYKTFLDLCKSFKLLGNTQPKDVKQYLVRKKS